MSLATLSFVVGGIAPALADKDDNRPFYGHRHHDDDDRGKKRRPVVIYQGPVVYQAPVVFTGGPPPWAPAHGYRYRRGQEQVYMAPFGIDRGRCDRELAGQVLGGIGGAVLGSQIGRGSGQIAAAAGGTLLGVLIGGAIGRSLDQADYACASQVLEHAPDHRPIVWQNPETGASYRMTPIGAFQSEGGYCREYTSTATVAGRSQQIFGTACRQPDGAWRIVRQ